MLLIPKKEGLETLLSVTLQWRQGTINAVMLVTTGDGTLVADPDLGNIHTGCMVGQVGIHKLHQELW